MDTFDERRREMQREHKRLERLAFAAWIIASVVTLAIVVVGIWAVIQLVGWLTS